MKQDWNRSRIAPNRSEVRTQSLGNQRVFVALRRTSHIIDACMHIQILKRLVEADCWLWCLCVTMEFELDFKLKSRVFTKKLVHGDTWTLAQTAERKSGKWLGSSSYSFTLRRSGFRKHALEHRRRHRWRRFCILHIIGPRSHVNSTRWQSLWDMLDTAKATRRVAQGDRASERHGKHHRWHTELLTECAQVWST